MTTLMESWATTPTSGSTSIPAFVQTDPPSVPNTDATAKPDVNMVVRTRAARSLRWTLLESVGLSGLSFIALIFYSRYLSAVEFGIAAVAIGIVQLLSVPVEILFHDALIRTHEATPRHVNSAFSASLVLGILLTCACWLLADHFAALIGQPEVGLILRWMSLGLVATGCGSALVAVQRRHMQFRTLALRSTIGRAGSAIIGIGLAVGGAGVWSLVAQQVFMPVLATIALWVMTADKPRLMLSRVEFVEMTRFGVIATSFSLMSLSTQRIFIIAVATFLGSQVAGVLSLAFRAVDMLRDIVGGAVAQLALPIFASLKGSRSDIQRTFTAAVRLTTALMFPVFTGLAVCSYEVVEVVFGSRWLAAAPFVSLLAVLTFQFFLRLFSVPIYNATGHPALPSAALLPQIVYVVIGMLIAGRFSFEAAAAVWASRLVLGLSIDLWLLRRVTGMSASVQLAGAVSPALAAMGMAVTVYGAKMGLLGASGPALRLATMVGVGAIIYVGLLWLLNRGLVLELVAFTREAVARSQ